VTVTTEAQRRGWVGALLDSIPTPLVLLEPGSAELRLANAAALAMAGGRLPIAAAVTPDAHLADARGRRIPRERMPDVLAARGEEVRDVHVEWHTPEGGMRPLVVTAGRVAAGEGQADVVLVAYEDVSDLARAGAHALHQADEIARLHEAAREAARRTDESVALLDMLFASAPVGLSYFDLDVRYVRINDAMAAINGLPREAHLGRTPEEVLPDLPAIGASLRRVLETGEPALDLEVSGQTPAAPGETRHWLSSHYPVKAPDGTVIGVGTVVHDVTERRRAEEDRSALLRAEREARARAERAERRWAFLAEATALLGASLEHEETMRRLAEIVVPAKADWCALHVRAPGDSVRLLAVAHVEPERERLAWEAHRRWPATLDDGEGIGAVIRSGEARAYRDLGEEGLRQLAGGDEDQLALLRGLGFASALVVPLELQGRTLGSLSLVLRPGRRFEDDDMELATELARRAAAAVENARLYRERSRIAQTLQQSLLPPHLPDIPGFEVAARYLAAGEGYDVGGDFYDVFATGGERWTAVIGDVQGKGPEAAALTALARHTVRAAAVHDPSPSRVLHQLNDAILRADVGERLMTAACVALRHDGVRASATVSSGGHPPPLVLRRDGRVEEIASPGLLLGLSDAPPLADGFAELEAGDSLVLYTDGVSDAMADRGPTGPAALAAALEGCEGLDASALAARVEQLAVGTGGARPRDDVALLVLRVRRPSGVVAALGA
jgi:PAS domain S-box-containing protein